jgi:hypothetical protein
MDPELVALAGTAGTTIVGLMATQAWESTRDGVVALWRRVLPERAETVGAELEAAREDFLGEEDAAAELATEWQGRFRRLLRAHPELADELREVLGVPAAPEPGTYTVTQSAVASGSSTVYQAGGHIQGGPR